MKNLFSILIFLVFCGVTTAQVPNSFNYQAVVRDNSAMPVVNTTVGVQVDILTGSTSGASVYNETLTGTTDANGILGFTIGGVSGVGNLDWGTTSYFIQVQIDPAGGTNYTISSTNPLASVPYAYNTQTAATALAADYANVTNAPTTITAAQATKIDNITITNAVDVDQLVTDAATNTAKVSFPGFGTSPGTALAGDQQYFTQNSTTSDIYYNSGGLGIGVPVGTDLQGVSLRINGGLKMDPVTTAPSLIGSLYYDDSVGDGSYFYINNMGASVQLNQAAATSIGGVWRSEGGDLFADEDVSIQASFGIGSDASATQDFGFNTVLLAENNLRILFDDTSTAAGDPNNDWLIQVNDTNNGGDNYFAIIDETNQSTAFRVDAGAPDNSMFIDSNGNVGLGTNTPSTTLDVNGTIKATAFVGDGSGLTGITNGTGGISNAGDTIIAADTDIDGSGQIVLQTGGTNHLVVSNTGNVGIGNNSPTTALDVVGGAKFDSVSFSEVSNSVVLRKNVTTISETDLTGNSLDASLKSVLIINGTVATTISQITNGKVGQIIDVTVLTNDVVLQHNAGGAGLALLLPNASDITLAPGASCTLVYDGSQWLLINLSN